MSKKPLLLIAAMAAGIALTTTAEARGFGERHGGIRAEAPAFEELDLNGDGTLTAAEIEEAMQALRAARFAAADTNGDGGLSAEEMIAAADARRAERMQDRVEEMIERADENADGLIQLTEMPEPGERGRGGLDRMFERLDANEDGLIDAEEFADARSHRRGN